MKRKKLRFLLACLLTLVMLASAVPVAAFAQPLQTFEFHHPMSVVEPRFNVPLASRDGIREILFASGERQLRIGMGSYHKGNNFEAAFALALEFEEYWETRSNNPADTDVPEGLNVELIFLAPNSGPAGGVGQAGTPGINFIYRGVVGSDPNHIPNVGPAWNNRPDVLYDAWADRLDGIIMGVAD